MKKVIVIMCLLVGALAEADNALLGAWKTIDDETHQPKSIVVLFEDNGTIGGRVEKLFRKPDEDQNPKCEKCNGDMKNKPVVGLQILRGLKKDSDTKWSGGDITDPKNGRTYSCKVELIENGTKLKVRGYLGFSLLGRTQVWEREAEQSSADLTTATPKQEPPKK